MKERMEMYGHKVNDKKGDTRVAENIKITFRKKGKPNEFLFRNMSNKLGKQVKRVGKTQR